jgi:hypothetical protein
MMAMQRIRAFVPLVVLSTAALAAGTAQARGGVDVHWQVQIGLPVPVVVVPAPRVYVPPPPPVYYPSYRHPSRWDVDGDGIPNRHDRVYNPRWDRDGDGRPDRYERHRYEPRYDGYRR